MATKQIKSLVQFSRGTSVVLANLATPIPDGVVVFSIDDGAFKIGDGITMYTALPILFTYADLVSAQGGISNLFQEPVVNDNGKIAVIKFDQMTNKVYYGVSDVTLASLLASVSQLESENTAQDTAIASLMNYALSIDAGINTAPDNNIVTINNRRYSNSGMSIDGMRTQIENLSAFTPGSHLLEPVFYADVNKTNEVDKENLLDNNTYYIDIKGFNNAATSVTYSLTAANSNVVITQIEGSLFSFQLNNLTGMTKDNVPFALIIGINNQDNNSPMKKAIGCKAYYRRIITGIYGGTNEDMFRGITTDSNGNIFAVGNSLSEDPSGSDYGNAIVAKFDSSLNIVKIKHYGTIEAQAFYSVAVDSSNNVYAVGFHVITGYSSNMLIVKFDNDLNLILSKMYSGGNNGSEERIYSVAIDSSNNIFCAGYTNAEGTGSPTATNGLIIKFDSSLNILFRKLYGGVGEEQFRDVVVDSTGNVYVVGNTTGNDYALIIKFDSSLNILLQKYYQGTTVGTYFYGVDIDSVGDVYCIGMTQAEGPGNYNGLIVKFNSSLNILARKIYGGVNDDKFRNISINSNDEIVCCGYTTSEMRNGANADALVVKFDKLLNIIFSKVCSGTGIDNFNDIIVDSNDNIIGVGWTASEGLGINDALIAKYPSNIPSGSFTGSTFSGLTLSDVTNLTLSDSNQTLVVAALTTTNSALTLSTTTLTLANGTLTYEREVLN